MLRTSSRKVATDRTETTGVKDLCAAVCIAARYENASISQKRRAMPCTRGAHLGTGCESARSRIENLTCIRWANGRAPADDQHSAVRQLNSGVIGASDCHRTDD